MTVHEAMVAGVIKNLEMLASSDDKEVAESRANELILKFLLDLDYEDVARAYKRVLNMSW